MLTNTEQLASGSGHAQPRRLELVREPSWPQLAWVPLGRTLHLTDVENLMGGPAAGAAAMTAARAGYTAIAPIHDGDHVVLACNPWLAISAAQVWVPGRLLVRHGKDGADRALLEAANPDDVARRYYRVVIGSGDGAFSPLAAQLRGRGVDVRVVARPGSVAGSLARAVKVIGLLRLPDDDPAKGEADGPQAA